MRKTTPCTHRGDGPFLRLTGVFFLILAITGCVLHPMTPEAAVSDGFDEALATRLEADDYGMRGYTFVLLKTGPAEINDPDRRRELFAGHFANMTRLAENGDLVLAGPLSDDTNKRGILILATQDIEEAKVMLEADPAVAAGIFVADYSGYYGSAGLMEMNALHKRVQRKTIGE